MLKEEQSKERINEPEELKEEDDSPEIQEEGFTPLIGQSPIIDATENKFHVRMLSQSLPAGKGIIQNGPQGEEQDPSIEETE